MRACVCRARGPRERGAQRRAGGRAESMVVGAGTPAAAIRSAAARRSAGAALFAPLSLVQSARPFRASIGGMCTDARGAWGLATVAAIGGNGGGNGGGGPVSPEEAARMRARIAELEAEVDALQSKVNEMNYLRGDTSNSSEKGSGGRRATGDAEAADAERLRIMRELVERDTGSDSVIMKRLAAELVATDLNANASAASLSAASAPPQNSIQQAAMLEDLFNRNYREELEMAADFDENKRRELQEKRKAFELKKDKLVALIDAAVKEAQAVCEVDNIASSDAGDAPAGNDCAAAWDEAEELAAELERQKRKNKDITAE